MSSKIYEIATEVQNSVNAFYDIFAKKIFNASTHRFEIKQEMIAKSGFWTKKKRYALWIISDNGVAVDKLEIKGLDVVRSSFPKLFQTFMKETLISILHGVDRDIIDESVINFKKTMKGKLYDETAKISSVKNIKKYEDPVKNDPIGKYITKTPAHVRSAIDYNKLLTIFKCPPKYARIRNGDKIKLVHLKTNIYGIKKMAFRGDGDPEEILNFIEQYFDSMSIFNAELYTKLVQFYSALGWQYPTETTKTASKFFSL